MYRREPAAVSAQLARSRALEARGQHLHGCDEAALGRSRFLVARSAPRRHSVPRVFQRSTARWRARHRRCDRAQPTRSVCGSRRARTHIHAPWLTVHERYYYLFYSADDTSSDGTSIGVARANTLLGPYAKSGAPSIVSAGDWAAPGMGTTIQTTDSDWFLVFHAWPKATLGSTPPGRHALLTRIAWSGDGWPSLLGAPFSVSQPLP